MVKRKLDSAVDESSVDQEIRKCDVTVTCEKSRGLHLAELDLRAGKQSICPSGRQNLGKV